MESFNIFAAVVMAALLVSAVITILKRNKDQKTTVNLKFRGNADLAIWVSITSSCFCTPSFVYIIKINKAL